MVIRLRRASRTDLTAGQRAQVNVPGGRASRESALSPSAPADRAAAVSPMGEGGAADRDAGTRFPVRARGKTGAREQLDDGRWTRAPGCSPGPWTTRWPGPSVRHWGLRDGLIRTMHGMIRSPAAEALQAGSPVTNDPGCVGSAVASWLLTADAQPPGGWPGLSWPSVTGPGGCRASSPLQW